METCVESLYSLDGGETEKRRTLDMIKVLKGAISVSKSKTGEVIYRHNKYDKRALRRQLDVYDRDAERARINTENQKRGVLRKWSLVFERQKKIGDSLKRFDDMLVSALDSQTVGHDEECDEKCDDDAHDDIQDQLRFSENNAPLKREKFNDGIAQSTYQTKMPKLPTNCGFLVQTAKVDSIPEKERCETEKSDCMMNYDPEAERSHLKEFLEEQKQIQKQLLTRNSISKLKRSVDREHSFYKHRVKCKLPKDPSSLVEKVENDRKLTRRASADRYFRSSLTNQGHIDYSRELTRRNTVQFESMSLTEIPKSAEHRRCNNFN